MNLTVTDYPLGKLNTFKIGGCAKLFAQPSSEKQLLDLLRFSKEKELPHLVMGRGSNLLISDKGWDGLVINIGSHFSDLKWTEMGAECLSGLSLDKLICKTVEKGCSGLEHLSGIPGTVGGAVVMNAGAYGSCIAESLLSVRALDPVTAEIRILGTDELELGYRTSIIKKKGLIVLSAEFGFRHLDPATLATVRRDVLLRRKEKQLLEYPNCGSVFKRPQGNYAGALIEKCSLKGYRCGDVEISSKHANFIVNRGEGKAEDVLRIINHVRKTVYEKFGVLLEPEVIFAGDFSESLYMPDSGLKTKEEKANES